MDSQHPVHFSAFFGPIFFKGVKLILGIFTKLTPIIQQGNSYHCMTEYYVTNL
jgi:hypothetical protein